MAPEIEEGGPLLCVFFFLRPNLFRTSSKSGPIKITLLRVIPTIAFQGIYSDTLPNLLSDILTVYLPFFLAFYLALYQELVVEVRRGPLRSSACSWGPAEEEQEAGGGEGRRRAGQLTYNLTTLTWLGKYRSCRSSPFLEYVLPQA